MKWPIGFNAFSHEAEDIPSVIPKRTPKRLHASLLSKSIFPLAT